MEIKIGIHKMKDNFMVIPSVVTLESIDGRELKNTKTTSKCLMFMSDIPDNELGAIILNSYRFIFENLDIKDITNTSMSIQEIVKSTSDNLYLIVSFQKTETSKLIVDKIIQDNGIFVSNHYKTLENYTNTEVGKIVLQAFDATDTTADLDNPTI